MSSPHRLTSRDFSRLGVALESIQTCDGIGEFGQQSMRVLARLIPCASVTFGYFDLATGCSYSDYDRDLGVSDAWYREGWALFGYQHPCVYSALVGERKPSVFDLDAVWSRSFQLKQPIYQEFIQPLGIRHQLALLLPGRERISGFAINRDTTPFSDADRRCLSLIASRLISEFERLRWRQRILGRTGTDTQLVTVRFDLLDWLENTDPSDASYLEDMSVISLPPRLRRVWMMAQAGMGVGEIAETLDVKLATARRYLRQAFLRS
jgi:hypothetical protein